MEANTCQWLMRGKFTHCLRRCNRGMYCSQHNFQIKNGAIPFQPCQKCHKGCKSEYRLCQGCGGNALRQKLGRIEERARKTYASVIKQIEDRTPI